VTPERCGALPVLQERNTDGPAGKPQGWRRRRRAASPGLSALRADDHAACALADDRALPALSGAVSPAGSPVRIHVVGRGTVPARSIAGGNKRSWSHEAAVAVTRSPGPGALVHEAIVSLWVDAVNARNLDAMLTWCASRRAIHGVLAPPTPDRKSRGTRGTRTDLSFPLRPGR
jgi:hypothetical protein